MATVLLATADTGLYDILNGEIAGQGHDLVWAVDGKEAYDVTLERAPDLVLLDVSLPIFNAFETCGLIRSDPEAPRDVPVILLSDDALNPRHVEKAAATDLFPKTHSAQELSDLLVKHLGPKAGS